MVWSSGGYPRSHEHMSQATLRFYAELNDFLPPEDRHRPVERPFHVRPSIKDLIEAAGVPHTEVDLVLVNGESVDFAYPGAGRRSDQRLPGLRVGRHRGGHESSASAAS